MKRSCRAISGTPGLRRSWVLVAAFAAGVSANCGSTTSAPTPPPPTPVVNTPPVINAISVPVTRAEVEQDVTVSADVSDAESAVDTLIYVWSANVGSLSGSGRTAAWRLAKGAATTPADVVITLTVVERFQDRDARGAAITRENQTMKNGSPFRVHDSNAELTKMATTFLVDYFGNSSVSPEACLVDFSDSCPGKKAELADIEDNREEYVQLSAKATVASITYDPTRTRADILAPCTFRARNKKTGHIGTVTGDCALTAVYETKRWWLCDSRFNNGRVVEGSPAMFLRWLNGSGS